MKVLLDTDIGTDSDDAVCLAYLLLHPDVELVGITTVGCDSAVRADIVRQLCAHFGQPGIPVAAGADQPIMANRYWPHHRVNQHVILDTEPNRRPARPQAAIELMCDCINANPEEGILVTVGLLTNAALLAMTEPEATAKLKSVFTMGGRFNFDRSQAKAECNIMLDAPAAAAVFQRELKQHTICPVDVTGPLGMSYEERQEILAGDHLAIVRECCDACNEAFKNDGTGLHDPFTATCALDESFAEWEQGCIHVEIQDYDLARSFKFDNDRVSGTTFFEPRADGPHRYAVAADRERYIEHLSSVFDVAR